MGQADMTVLIMQARLGSKRLPGKALLPLGNKCIVARAMESLAPLEVDAKVLAVPYDSSEALAPIARSEGYDLVAGSEEDVLSRFAKVIAIYAADTIVRATGDNPFVSLELARSLIHSRGCPPADYSAYRGMPIGMGVELVNAKSLLEANHEAKDPYEREHVCPYLYRNPDRFVTRYFEAPNPFRLPEAKISVDTEADYRLAQAAFDALWKSGPPSGPALVKWLASNGGVYA